MVQRLLLFAYFTDEVKNLRKMLKPSENSLQKIKAYFHVSIDASIREFSSHE